MFVDRTPMLLEALPLNAHISCSQSHSHVHLICLLPQGFLSKGETACNLHWNVYYVANVVLRKKLNL